MLASVDDCFGEVLDVVESTQAYATQMDDHQSQALIGQQHKNHVQNSVDDDSSGKNLSIESTWGILIRRQNGVLQEEIHLKYRLNQNNKNTIKCEHSEVVDSTVLNDENCVDANNLNKIFNKAGDVYLIGRSHLCDIQVNEKRVSARHCIIYCDYTQAKMRVFVEDYSSNGTYVNDSLIKLSHGERMELRSGDEIYLINPRNAQLQTPGGKGLHPAPTGQVTFMFINIRDRLAANREVSFAPVLQSVSIPDVRESATARHMEDEYVIGDMIGAGMSGQVYFCIHRQTKRKCAVKIIDTRKFNFNPGIEKEDLKQEADMMRELHHVRTILYGQNFILTRVII